MTNFTIKVKVTVSKASSASKIMHLALVINLWVTGIKELNKIQKEFINVIILKQNQVLCATSMKMNA